MVESQPSKLLVAGPIPVPPRSIPSTLFPRGFQTFEETTPSGTA